MSFASAALARAREIPVRGTVLDAAEAAFVLVALFMMSQALLSPLFAGPDVLEEPGWMRTMWLPVYGGLVLFGAARMSRLGSVLPAALLTAPLIILAFVSVNWSLIPEVTTRRAVALAFTTFFGLYLAARYDWRALVEMLAGLFFVLAVGSTAAALLFPSFGVDASVHPGAWKGLWLEKNALGAAMTRGVLACACAAILSPRRRTLWVGAALFCAALVLASTSTTALLGLLLACAALLGLRMLRSGGVVAVAGIWLSLVMLLGFAVLFALAPDVVFQLVGKDSTLTGRTDIWDSVLRQVAARPDGHGYAAFWTSPTGPAAIVRAEADWAVPNAHNGWLEMMLWFGQSGVWIFAAHCMIVVGASLARIWSADGGAYFAVPSTLLFVLFSLSESTIMQWNNLSWVLYVAILAKLLQVSMGPERRTSAVP